MGLFGDEPYQAQVYNKMVISWTYGRTFQHSPHITYIICVIYVFYTFITFRQGCPILGILMAPGSQSGPWRAITPQASGRSADEVPYLIRQITMRLFSQSWVLCTLYTFTSASCHLLLGCIYGCTMDGPKLLSGAQKFWVFFPLVCYYCALWCNISRCDNMSYLPNRKSYVKK